MVQNLVQAADDLLNDGFAILQDSWALMPEVRQVFSNASQFFAGEVSEKNRASSPEILEGYLPQGSEFSVDENRPDLCEGFAVWGINAGDSIAASWARQNLLHKAMFEALPSYTAVVNDIFESLRQKLNPAGDRLAASEYSYLQLNHYRPADFDRDLLQDAHEDGHLITMLRPTARGAEIWLDGEYRRVALADDEFLLMPGSLLTTMTGGRIAPLVHRVRNDLSTQVRQSLMFFVNPSLDEPVSPWLGDGTALSMVEQAVDNSQHFGLRSIRDLQRHHRKEPA